MLAGPGSSRACSVVLAGDANGQVVDITPLDHVDDDTLGAMRRLVGQLSSSALPMTTEQLVEVIETKSCTIFVASIDGEICGMLTLVTFPIPTGVRAWIEDVVVDVAARGEGVGSALTQRALDVARDRGARTVSLTSRPSREAANSMYEKLGFRRRDTNVYRYELA